MSDEIHVITKSRLETWNRCQRLEDYTYRRRYRPVISSTAAAFGDLVHKGLEAWWKAWQRGEMLALPDAIAAMTAHRETVVDQVDEFMLVAAVVLLTAYDARWASSMGDYEVIGVEVEFVATVPGRKRLRVAGKLDVLVKKRSDGTVWYVEHKTSGVDLSAGSTYWQRLRMDPQVSIYSDGTRALGHEPAGCVYDVLATPTLRPLKATPVEKRKYTKPTKAEPVSRLYKGQRENDETPDEFRDRLAAAILERPEEWFGRADVVRLDSELEASRVDVEESALQIRRGSVTGTSPRNPAACHLYGRTCAFLGVCDGTEGLEDASKFRKLEVAHAELDAANKV